MPAKFEIEICYESKRNPRQGLPTPRLWPRGDRLYWGELGDLVPFPYKPRTQQVSGVEVPKTKAHEHVDVTQHADASARSPEEFVVGAVRSAARAPPAVLYMPRADMWSCF